VRFGIPSRNALLAGLIALLPLSFFAAEVKIVANPSVNSDSISAAELRSVFLSETRSLKDGSHVEPVFQRSGPVHDAFLRQFLKLSSETLEAHYGSLVFTGKAAMPKSFDSDAGVLAYVTKTRGAIGYVSESANGEGIKTLEVEENTKGERKLLTRVEPQYPDTLRQMGITGIVRLEVVISLQGKVESVTLIGGNPILADAAIKAVKQWVYAPAPARSKLEVVLRFDDRH
jgi:TonB family protein